MKPSTCSSVARVRRLHFIVALLALAGCGTSDPPPGELIGAFRFVAALDPTPEEGRCTFSGAPTDLSFEGVLSYDKDAGKLWFTTGDSRREGHLAGSSFSTRTPPQGEGVARRFNSCTCQMRMAEAILGEILAAKDCQSTLAPSSAPVAAPERTCPELLPDGKESWANCGCVLGIIREEVEFPAGEDCTCAASGVQQPAPARCEFLYLLEGTLM